jgi:hypothetical protein
MDPWMRASDADRERVVGALHEQVGTGRLTVEEVLQRSAARRTDPARWVSWTL